MVVQEQNQLEIGRIFGKVVGNLTLERCIAFYTMTCMDFFQQEVAICKVQNTIQCAYVIGLQVVLAKWFGFLCKKLVQSVLCLEVQLTGQLWTNAECPDFSKHDNITANGLQTFTQALQESVRLSQRMVNAESIYSHVGEFFRFVNHETDHIWISKIEFGQVAIAQERYKFIIALIFEEEPVTVSASVLQQCLLEHRSLIPAMVWYEVADNF